MKYPIHNRSNNAVQFTADIDCAESASEATKKGLAVLWALKNGADLSGANLSRAKIKSLVARVTRIIEPYEFLAFQTEDDKCVIVAGCHGPWTVEEHRAHIAENYPNTPKSEETLAILGFIEERAKAVMISRMED